MRQFRTVAAAVAACAMLAVTACSGESSDSPEYSSAYDIRDAMKGTEFECLGWDDQSGANDGSVDEWNCQTADGWLARIQMPDDMEYWKNTRDRDGELALWAIYGDGWGVDCYAEPHERCAALAEVLGGDQVNA